MILSFVSCKREVTNLPKPNVILIVTDDQGWGDLGIHGNTIVNTPNIDKLGGSGVTFSRFYVSPVCSPTRAEILTGRYHPRGGVYSTSRGGERLDLDEKTIGDVFLRNGYHTAAFGKWHSGTQPPYHPNNRGFKEFYGFCSGHWGNYFSPMLDHNGKVVQGRGFLTDDLTDRALSYISRNQDTPFFMHMAYNTPHSPMSVPDQWWNKYNKNAPIDSNHRYGQLENPDKTRAALALCENIDWNVGRLIKRLDSLSLLENTIVIYMSDNGPNGWRWNNELKGIKGSTDEGGVLSPFIIFWKDIIEGQKVDKIVSAIDILPTLIELTGINDPYDRSIDGISLRPLLLGVENNWKDRYLFSHWRGQVSVRNQQYLLNHEDQIFDLLNDPGQMEVLSNIPDSIRLKLEKAKLNWNNSVLHELNTNRDEVFPIGYPDSRFTHLPARDGKAHGNIQRSNRWPNSSYFTNWSSSLDSITWNCDILTSGDYGVTVYYTCSVHSVGSHVVLSQGKNKAVGKIKKEHDPSFESVNFDRIKREESYEKNFRPLDLGVIHLEEGEQMISLTTPEVRDSQFIDVRLLVLEHNFKE